jgi:integrase
VTKNVAAMVKLPPLRKRKASTWTTDQARTFLESARESDDPLYAAYVVVLVLGLRKGEVLGPLWTAVDWGGWDKPCDEHGEHYCEPYRDLCEVGLQVEKQIQRVKGRLLHRETKTEESDAPLPLPPICAIALRLRQLHQQQAATAAGETWQDTGLIFTTRLGTPIEPRNFYRSWHARCARAGVPPISVHDARRTCASLLVDLDVHPRIAMAILRHADFSITMEVYSQVSSKATRDALKRLGDSLEKE